jgi:DNA repair exonuclease SbcCD ATPase subunit
MPPNEIIKAKAKLDAQKQQIAAQKTNTARAKMNAQKQKIAAQKAKLQAKLGETREKVKDKYAKGMTAAREFDQKISHKNMGRKDDGICPCCKRPLDNEGPIGGQQPFDDEAPYEDE